MRRAHAMPFGAECRDGRVRFRLWAPSAARVELCLEGGEPPQPLYPVGEGWHELVSAEAGPGSRYRYRIDGELQVPDPASRFNPDDCHGPSEVIDPGAYAWRDGAWRGRPWQEAVIYELHVGSFSREGSFAAVSERLPELAALGITAIELMPVADFPGARNWGYDGVLPYAPDSRYGRPEALKALVDTAHGLGLMVFLDVVYNHFGPEGSYLHAYAQPFFTERHHTPWGAAINLDGPDAAPVREFFIHNALYWLEEYHLDGLRLDAVHALHDARRPDFVEELAGRVREGPGRRRHVHLILENEHNTARYLADGATAQWNDDAHHCFHVLLTGETDGYYRDFAQDTVWRLGRCLAEGFGYQGEPSALRGGAPRGEPSGRLAPGCFVDFLQNHDQIGNRAFGERLTELAPEPALRAAMAILLLSPHTPMLFMGEEWGSRRPFPFFCDFAPALAEAVREGRRREFAHFQRFADPAARQAIPDPTAVETFERARLDWAARTVGAHERWLAYCRQLLSLRRERLLPHLGGGAGGEFALLGDRGLRVSWRLKTGASYQLSANLGPEPLSAPVPALPVLYADFEPGAGVLPPWSVLWQLEARHG